MTQGFSHSQIINNVYDKKAVSCLPGRSYRLRQDNKAHTIARLMDPRASVYESKSKKRRIEKVRSSQVSVLNFESQSEQQHLQKKWQESWIYNQLVERANRRGGFIPKFPTTTTLLDALDTLDTY